MGAKCLVDEYKEDPMVHYSLKKQSKEDCARDIPGWLLNRYNKRVQNAIEGPNKKTKMRMQDKLLVQGFEWSTHLKVVVHKYGIGGLVDESDIEHALCGL